MPRLALSLISEGSHGSATSFLTPVLICAARFAWLAIHCRLFEILDKPTQSLQSVKLLRQSLGDLDGLRGPRFSFVAFIKSTAATAPIVPDVVGKMSGKAIVGSPIGFATKVAR